MVATHLDDSIGPMNKVSGLGPIFDPASSLQVVLASSNLLQVADMFVSGKILNSSPIVHVFEVSKPENFVKSSL